MPLKFTKSSQKATKGRRPKPLVKHMHQKGIKFTHNIGETDEIEWHGWVCKALLGFI